MTKEKKKLYNDFIEVKIDIPIQNPTNEMLFFGVWGNQHSR